MGHQGSNCHSTVELLAEQQVVYLRFNSPSGSGFSNGSLNGSLYVVTGSSNGNFFEYSGYTTGDLIDDNPMNTEEGPVLDLEVGSSWSFFSLSLPGITLSLKHLLLEPAQLSWKTVMI